MMMVAQLFGNIQVVTPQGSVSKGITLVNSEQLPNDYHIELKIDAYD